MKKHDEWKTCRLLVEFAVWAILANHAVIFLTSRLKSDILVSSLLSRRKYWHKFDQTLLTHFSFLFFFFRKTVTTETHGFRMEEKTQAIYLKCKGLEVNVRDERAFFHTDGVEKQMSRIFFQHGFFLFKIHVLSN